MAGATAGAASEARRICLIALVFFEFLSGMKIDDERGPFLGSSWRTGRPLGIVFVLGFFSTVCLNSEDFLPVVAFGA